MECGQGCKLCSYLEATDFAIVAAAVVEFAVFVVQVLGKMLDELQPLLQRLIILLDLRRSRLHCLLLLF